MATSPRHDPTGEDIERDLIARTNCWKTTRRIALTEQQVTDYRLPGLRADPRGATQAAWRPEG